MKSFTTGLLLWLSACAFGAELYQRDAASIITALQNIDNGTQQVLADVNAFQGGRDGVNQAVKIQTDSNTLNQIIQNGITAAQATTQLNDADSAAVANAVTKIQPGVFNVLTALTNKKELFSAASLGFDAIPLVENALTSQRQSTNDFGNNVTAVLSTTIKRVSPLLTTNIDFHFVRALQAFATE